jgi:hypothetical protein
VTVITHNMVMTDYYAESRVLFEANLENAFFIRATMTHAIHANSYPSTISGHWAGPGSVLPLGVIAAGLRRRR